jgi:ABC-2 type transport system permease protein
MTDPELADRTYIEPITPETIEKVLAREAELGTPVDSLLPTLILSGFIFPIASMPAAIQAITYITPARYFLVLLRAIVLKGAGLGLFPADSAALCIYAVMALGLASVRLARERG